MRQTTINDSRLLNMSASIRVEDLCAGYGAVQVLDRISLAVNDGETVALLGTNGNGKSTLMKCIMGIVPPGAGRITATIDGVEHDLAGRATEEIVELGIALVPEGRRLFPRLTVEENLLMGLATKPGSTPIPQRIFDMFPVLKQMMYRRGGDLSGGQQQQLAIGRALAMGPKLLILDEPTEGIQPSIIKDIERAIRMLAATGEMAILLVEQYYDFAESLADQYLLMERGEFIMRGRGETMPQDGVREALAV